MNTLAIIQARTGATRLPSKVLLPLMDKTVLEHVVSRVEKANSIDDIVVATTIEKSDLRIVELCSKNNLRVFCGSQEDVLDRYYQVVKLLKPENIVRITADCPMIDYCLVDEVTKEHIRGDYDYTSNTIDETFPDGLDVEIMKYEALEESWYNANKKYQREHVTQYILGSDKFRKGRVVSEKYYGNKRWTLDTVEDYEFLKEVFARLYKENQYFVMKDILSILEKYPAIELINNHITRNAGLIKSLKSDCETEGYHQNKNEEH